jgi:hypothetical protein
MTHTDTNSTVPTNATLQPLPRQSQKQLLAAYGVVTTALLLYELYTPNTDSFLLNFAAVLITLAALLPSYLWCAGYAQGMPIFPLFAITFVWTYGLPLVSKTPAIVQYSVSSQWVASLTTAGFLFIGTVVWFQFVKVAPPAPRSYRALGDRQGDQFFLWALAISVFFNIGNAGGWLALSPDVFVIVRNVIIALTALGGFVLSYRLGTQALSRQQSGLLVVLIGAFMVTSAVSLLLVGAATVFLSAVAAFIIGRKKVPLLTILLVCLCLAFLQPGKADLRSKYWFSSASNPYVQPWDYPALFIEWTDASFQYFSKQDASTRQTRQSFAERASVIQMLLLAQTKSPAQVPYLHGKTYKILPQLIVPRILNPNKIRSHEGTYILSVHYGQQKYEDTARTTIGWGLLAESYANFGFFGCAGLAVIVASIFGQATRWSIGAPILSGRSMLTVLMLTFAIQTEWTAGVYVAAFFQYVVVLGGIVVFLMQNYRMQHTPLLNYE